MILSPPFQGRLPFHPYPPPNNEMSLFWMLKDLLFGSQGAAERVLLFQLIDLLFASFNLELELPYLLL